MPVAASSIGVAAIGLLGSLIGGVVAGATSYAVSRQARDAAEKSWIRDTRREVFDRFLTRAQDLQAACQIYHHGHRTDASRESVEKAFREFFNVYAVVQTVAEKPVVDTTRLYGYRLHSLADQALDRPGRLRGQHFDDVDKLVRLARHGAVDAMRFALGSLDSAAPPPGFNPFKSTELERDYDPNQSDGVANAP
jgi:hypothetical protein